MLEGVFIGEAGDVDQAGEDGGRGVDLGEFVRPKKIHHPESGCQVGIGEEIVGWWVWREGMMHDEAYSA